MEQKKKNSAFLPIIVIGTLLIGVVMVLNSGAYELSSDQSTSCLQSQTYCLNITEIPSVIQPNTPITLKYVVENQQGQPLKTFETVHERIMHFIVVRKDLEYFQHLHPAFDSRAGIFTLSNLIFQHDGEYRIFADFTPMASSMGHTGRMMMDHGNDVTVPADISVGDFSAYHPEPLKEGALEKTVDDLEISLRKETNMLVFDIKKNAKPVTDLEPYLGALGHAVILHEGDLDFLHAHPQESLDDKQTGTVSFMAEFPKSGYYKVFAQFQHQRKIITVDFVLHL